MLLDCSTGRLWETIQILGAAHNKTQHCHWKSINIQHKTISAQKKMLWRIYKFCKCLVGLRLDFLGRQEWIITDIACIEQLYFFQYVDVEALDIFISFNTLMLKHSQEISSIFQCRHQSQPFGQLDAASDSCICWYTTTHIIPTCKHACKQTLFCSELFDWILIFFCLCFTRKGNNQLRVSPT